MVIKADSAICDRDVGSWIVCDRVWPVASYVSGSNSIALVVRFIVLAVVSLYYRCMFGNMLDSQTDTRLPWALSHMQNWVSYDLGLDGYADYVILQSLSLCVREVRVLITHR